MPLFDSFIVLTYPNQLTAHKREGVAAENDKGNVSDEISTLYKVMPDRFRPGLLVYESATPYSVIIVNDGLERTTH